MKEITQKAQNCLTYSELLSVFTFHEGEPKGEPGRVHILILAGCSLKPLAFRLVFQKFQMALNVLRTCFLTILHRLRAIAEKFFFECLFVRPFVRSFVRSSVRPHHSGTPLNLARLS